MPTEYAKLLPSSTSSDLTPNRCGVKEQVTVSHIILAEQLPKQNGPDSRFPDSAVTLPTSGPFPCLGQIRKRFFEHPSVRQFPDRLGTQTVSALHLTPYPSNISPVPSGIAPTEDINRSPNEAVPILLVLPPTISFFLTLLLLGHHTNPTRLHLSLFSRSTIQFLKSFSLLVLGYCLPH